MGRGLCGQRAQGRCPHRGAAQPAEEPGRATREHTGKPRARGEASARPCPLQSPSDPGPRWRQAPLREDGRGKWPRKGKAGEVGSGSSGRGSWSPAWSRRGAAPGQPLSNQSPCPVGRANWGRLGSTAAELPLQGFASCPLHPDKCWDLVYPGRPSAWAAPSLPSPACSVLRPSASFFLRLCPWVGASGVWL